MNKKVDEWCVHLKHTESDTLRQTVGPPLWHDRSIMVPINDGIVEHDTTLLLRDVATCQLKTARHLACSRVASALTEVCMALTCSQIASALTQVCDGARHACHQKTALASRQTARGGMDTEQEQQASNTCPFLVSGRHCGLSGVQPQPRPFGTLTRPTLVLTSGLAANPLTLPQRFSRRLV